MNIFVLSRYDEDDNRICEVFVPQRNLQVGYSNKRVSPSVVADHLRSDKFACTGFELDVQVVSTDSGVAKDYHKFTCEIKNPYLTAYSVMVEADKIIDRLKESYL